MNRWRLLLAALLFVPSIAGGTPTFTLQGTVRDLAGQPVAEAEVFLYRSANTRRPADFISAKTGPDGAYRLAVPAGIYWGVARIKQGERYGPLATGQRHSGEPVQIAVEDEPATSTDFAVADLKEMAQKQPKGNVEVVAVSGLIVDRAGQPVAGASAFARIGQMQATLPEFISAWTGADGRFVLHLPPGDYYWGATRDLPPTVTPDLIAAPAAEGQGELKLILTN